MVKKAMIALSGGVDSSVAAKLIKEQGYDCIGVTMRLNSSCSGDASCLSDQNIIDAKNIAEGLGMPYYLFDFEADFEKEVISRFISAYENGFTPNPCIDCNRYMKFEKLYQSGREKGYDYIVTGHYAKIEYNENTCRYVLKKAKDALKDQSYVLYSLTQEQLSHTLFPLGNFTKAEIREMALSSGFFNAEKKDSQDICFVPDGDYAAFIQNYTGKKYPEGDYIDISGKVLGKHKGIINYTIGQRRGLGVALGKYMYVISKNAENNTVILGDETELFYKNVIVKDINLISVSEITRPIRAKVKLRYKHTEQPATIVPNSDRTVTVCFDEPQRAPSAGQSAVFYDEDTVIGGGIIVKGI